MTDGDIYEKTGPSTWTLRSNIRGPAGPQGPAGATGPQGPAGAGSAVPARLETGTQTGGITVTDWNNARQSGWYDGLNAANAPAAGWWQGEVITHRGTGGASDYITQRLWDFTNGSQAAQTSGWQRQCINSAWTAWMALGSGARYAALYGCSAAQSLPPATWYSIPWDIIRYASPGMASGTYYLYAPVAGVYQMTVNLYSDGGIYYLRAIHVPSYASVITTRQLSLSWAQYLNASDAIYIQTWNDAESTYYTLMNQGVASPSFSMALIS